tara:strand:+ start:296 stop:694 length:399 start_codon:yes stop_codon:yes gene_type:complete
MITSLAPTTCAYVTDQYRAIVILAVLTPPVKASGLMLASLAFGQDSSHNTSLACNALFAAVAYITCSGILACDANESVAGLAQRVPTLICPFSFTERFLAYDAYGCFRRILDITTLGALANVETAFFFIEVF